MTDSRSTDDHLDPARVRRPSLPRSPDRDARATWWRRVVAARPAPVSLAAQLTSIGTFVERRDAEANALEQGVVRAA